MSCSSYWSYCFYEKNEEAHKRRVIDSVCTQAFLCSCKLLNLLEDYFDIRLLAFCFLNHMYIASVPFNFDPFLVFFLSMLLFSLFILIAQLVIISLAYFLTAGGEFYWEECKTAPSSSIFWGQRPNGIPIYFWCLIFMIMPSHEFNCGYFNVLISIVVHCFGGKFTTRSFCWESSASIWWSWKVCL